MVNNKESININEKYSLEKRKMYIEQFMRSNSNKEGIDLKELYVGQYSYIGCESDCLALLNNKATIVYCLRGLEKEALFMDLFQERLLETKTYVLPGVLSFAPFVRKGLTIAEIMNLSNLLNLSRMSLERLKEFYSSMNDCNYYEFLNRYNSQLMASLDNEFRRRRVRK